MKRRTVILLICIAVLGLLLRVLFLKAQVPTADDLGVAFSAANYTLHGTPGPSMPFHPRLRDIAVFVFTSLFGGTPLGIKGWSVLLGSATVPLLGVLIWRLTRNESAALLGSALLAIDIVHIDYSRQAVQEAPASFFLLLSIFLIVESIVEGPSRRWRWLLPCAGVTFGLATASKFYAIPALAASIIILSVWCWRRKAYDELLFVIASLGVVSVAVFVATYIPWFARGYDFLDWIGYQRGLLQTMVTHTRDFGYILFDEPSQWFVRPFTAFVDTVISPDGRIHSSVATGNPLVWMAVLPSVAYSLWRKRNRKSHQLLQVFFWVTYLPLATSSRPVWVLASVAVIPLAIAFVALAVTDLSRRYSEATAPVYFAAVLVTSLLMYPLAIGKALDYPYLTAVVRVTGGPLDHNVGGSR